MRKTCAGLGLGLVLTLWCLAPFVQAGEETKEVVAVGMADGTSSRARDEALNDALRRAVEQGVGTFVSAELSVEQQRLVEERIYTATQGYVQTYRVTRESKEDGIYEVEIAALVKMGKLEGDLRSIGLLIQKKQNPRVMVVVTSQEVDSSYLGVQVEGNQQVENQVEGGLMQKGFQLVDAGQVARKKQLESLLLGGDPTRAAKMAKDFGAEILVQGDVRRSFVDVREVLGRQMRFFSNEVRLKALETDTAKILWSGYRTRPPSGAGSLIPLEESTSELIREMVAGILDQWRKDVYQAGSYQLEITQVSFNQLKAFKEGLSRIRGVGSVQTRNYQSGHALLQVQYQGPIAELADKIATIKQPAPEITGLQANTIEIRIRK